MIQLINFPEENSILLDGNNTAVKIKSTNGVGFYFRAEISINDELFDTQSWSRQDNFTATKDLIYLYHAYFEALFNSTFNAGLTEQTSLIKKVSIVVKEYQLSNDQQTASLVLPDFYIMYNATAATFNDTSKAVFLGVDPDALRVPANGKISLPFFVNAEGEDVTVTVKDDQGTPIDTQTVANVTGKKVYLYNLNLAALSISYYRLYVTATITVGAATITKTFNLMRNPHFEVKELMFKNNFGYFLPAYFDGEMEIQEAFDPETYTEENGEEEVFTVSTEKSYTINTNNLVANEKAIIAQVAKSVKCYLHHNAQWFEINTKTSKTTEHQDKNHQFNTKLAFEFKTGLPFTNANFAEQPTLTDLVFYGVENQSFEISKAELDAAFSGTPGKIYFSSLPANGTLYFMGSGGFLSAIFLNQSYNWTAINYFVFVPDNDEFGAPYTSFEFAMAETLIYSELATATINIFEEGSASNEAPNIDVFPTHVVEIDENGDGSLNIAATVTDPDGDLDTILWEIEGTTPTGISLSNTSTATVTITASGASQGYFYLKITAADLAGNIAERLLTVFVEDELILIESDLQSSTSTTQTWEVTINGGTQGENIDIVFDYNVYDSNRYAQVTIVSNTGSAERIVNLANRLQTITAAFDSNQEITLNIFMDDAGSEDHQTMAINIENPTRGTVDPDNAAVTI